MKLHEVWRHEYRSRRYLEYASSADLAQRIRDCMNNLIVLTPEAKIGVVPMNSRGQFLTRKFTHALEEYSIRREALPFDLMRDHALPAPLAPRRGRRRSVAAGWDSVLPELPDRAIVKYGKLAHLQAALDGDGILISPASSYGDPSLGPHRYDNEQERPVHFRPDGGTVRLVERQDGTKVDPPTEMPVIGNVTFTNEMIVDYYVWCASSVLAPRLFVDFEADACLIIREPDVFHKRIAWAIGMALRGLRPPLDNLSVQTNRVRYYDPYDAPKGCRSIKVPWHKPFQYLYQREWRLIALLDPPTAGDLPVLWIDPGPLADIAEIVYVGELDGSRYPYRDAIVQCGGTAHAGCR